MTEQKATNIVWHQGAVTRDDREKLNGHKGCTVWLTGLSGSGKSTIAVDLEKRLWERGVRAYILDGDNIRHGLNKNLGFSPEDRTENIRRIGEVAKLFTDAGVVALTAFISPYRADRDQVRAIMARGRLRRGARRLPGRGLRAARREGPLQEGPRRRDQGVHRHLGALRGARRSPSSPSRRTSSRSRRASRQILGTSKARASSPTLRRRAGDAGASSPASGSPGPTYLRRPAAPRNATRWQVGCAPSTASEIKG